MKTTTSVPTRLAWALASVVVVALSGCQRGTPTLDTKTFTVKYLDNTTLSELIDPYVFKDREGAPGSYSAAPGAITVRETRDNLEKIARVLQEYDVPRPDIRLHFQLIEADGFTDTDPAIAPVEAQLRKVFQFKGYHLVGEALVGATDGTEIRQRLRDGYVLGAHVYRTDPSTVRVQEIQLFAPGLGTVLQTTVNVRVGQVLVVGTAAKGSNSTATLLLTVQAEESKPEG